MKGHMEDQGEIIIPHHYNVVGYKNKMVSAEQNRTEQNITLLKINSGHRQVA